jgi:hypothetical protein
MVLAFENFRYSGKTPKGKPYFVPTDRCRDVGSELMELVRARIKFEHHYYHFSKGAHVAALHSLREHRYFAHIDLKNFFYSVGRNRVKAALKAIGVPRAEHYAKWSTVRNPFGEPRYALPYGFPQSPLLASLVLRGSALGTAIQRLPPEIHRSVYLDDIAISANDMNVLYEAFSSLIASVEAANFVLNDEKASGPAPEVRIFNCDLANGKSTVTASRIAEFYAEDGSDESVAGFERYRESVAAGNL